MFRFFRRWYYSMLEMALVNKIARGHAIVEDDKAILMRDTKRLSDAYRQLRETRARLVMIEPPQALITEAMRRA